MSTDANRRRQAANSRAYRQRKREGTRFVDCSIELAPGLVMQLAQIVDPVAFGDFLVKTKRLSDWETELPDKIDEAVRVLIESKRHR